jgi:hypothetical protein
MLVGFEDHTAYAQTIVAFCDGCGDDPKVHIFDGRTDGVIVPARGPLDFGWVSTTNCTVIHYFCDTILYTGSYSIHIPLNHGTDVDTILLYSTVLYNGSFSHVAFVP